MHMCSMFCPMLLVSVSTEFLYAIMHNLINCLLTAHSSILAHVRSRYAGMCHLHKREFGWCALQTSVHNW